MNAEELLALVEKEEERRGQSRHRVAVCSAAGCLSLGSERVNRPASELTITDAW